MSLANKILVVVILLLILSNILIVFHYEKKLRLDENDVTIIGGMERNKKYTAHEILKLIKNSPEYLGDSLVIYVDGKLRTDNPKLQGTIDVVSTNDKAAIDQQVLDSDLPRPFLIYKLASHYYRSQYANEFKKDTSIRK